MNEEAKRPDIAAPPNAHVKLLIEFGPLAAFGITYFTAGIFWATGVVMVTSVLALAASWVQFGMGFGTAKAVIASRGCDGTCFHAVSSLAGADG